MISSFPSSNVLSKSSAFIQFSRFRFLEAHTHFVFPSSKPSVLVIVTSVQRWLADVPYRTLLKRLDEFAP